MMEHRDEVAIDDLLSRLERQWKREHDPRVIDRMVEENPRHADELFEYFSFLVNADSGLLDDREGDARLATHVARWLKSEGLHLAGAIAHEARSDEGAATTANTPATPSTGTRPAEPSAGPDPGNARGLSLSGLLSRLTGRRPSEVAATLGLTSGFMAALSAHHQSIPLRAREVLADRATQRLGVDREKVLACLRETPNLPAAAAREAPYENRPLPWSEVVRMADMSKDEQVYWLALERE